MVKLSVFPKCWLDELCNGRMKLTEWIDISRQLACDGLEFYTAFLESYDEPYLKKLARYVNDRGMMIPMICHSPDFTVPDKEQRKLQIKHQKEVIRATAILGGTFTRVLSGQNYPGIVIQEGIDCVVDCIGQCLPEAENYGVKLVMENHYKDGYWKYPEFAQRIEIFTSIIERIDSPYFGVQFDPSNAIMANEDPLELLNLVAERVYTMHASDRYIKAGYDRKEVLAHVGQTGYHPALLHGVIGQGLNDYPAIFNKLRSVSFDGWISIEDGINGMDDMKKSADYLRKI